MELVRDDLLPSARVAARLVGKAEGPLALVLLRGRRGSLEMTVSNGTTMFRKEVEGDVGEFLTLVPAIDFQRAIEDAEENVTVEVTSRGVRVGKVSLRGVSVGDDLTPAMPSDPLFECWSGPLSDAIELATAFTDRSNTRLGCVSFEENDGAVEVVATDSFKLLAAKALTSEADGEMAGRRDVLLDGKLAGPLAKWLDDQDDIVTVYADPKTFRFSIPSADWITPRSQEQFIEWRSLLPMDDPAGSVFYEQAEMVGVLSEVAKAGVEQVELTCTGEAVELSTKDGEVMRELSSGMWIAHEQERCSVVFNVKYLLAIVKGTQGGPLDLRSGESRRPTVALGDARTGMVMPVRTVQAEAKTRSVKAG